MTALTPDDRERLARRAEWGVIFAGLLAAAVLAKLFAEQVPLRPARLALGEKIIPGLPPEPGEPGPIYAHGGELVARSVVRHAICANPSAYATDDARFTVARALSQVTGVPVHTIYPRLAVPRRPLNTLARQVPREVAEQVRSLNAKGISIRTEQPPAPTHPNAPTLAPTRDVCADPAAYATNREREQVAAQLAPILGRERDAVYQALFPQWRTFCYVARQASPEVVEAVRALDLDGVFTRPEYARVYPQGSLAANVLGRRGVDDIGLTGIEHLWGFCLNGKPSSRRANMSACGQTIIGPDTGFVPAEPGCKVILTLRLPLQKVAEAAMDDLVKAHKPQGGATCVVLDPRDGQILAAATRPTFDPNNPGQAQPGDFICRPASDVFEPGSTLKTAIVGAALDSGAITPRTVFHCRGTTEIGKRPLSCWGEYAVKGHGAVTAADIIAKSCNIGAAQVALTMKPEVLYRYLERMRVFEYEERTRTYQNLKGVHLYDTLDSGLDGERPAYVPLLSALRRRGQANIGFGQGIYLTDLHMVAIYGAIANGGTFYYPNFVREVRTATGRLVRRRDPLKSGALFKPQTTALLRQYLEGTVDHGTGAVAAIPGVRVGGKTGTAQIYDYRRGAFLENEYVMSFIAVAPIEAPRLVVFVRVERPQIGRHGADTAAPTVKRVLEAALRLGDD